MAVKKINALCAWILTAVLLVHVSTTICFLFTGWFNMTLFVVAGRAVGALCITHVCLGLVIVFFLHDGTRLNGYGGLNRRTLIQRATGLAILVLVHPHVGLFESFIYEGVPLAVPQKIHVFVVEVLFFAVIFLHLSQSFSRSLITMGLLRSEEAEKRVDLIAGIVCGGGLAVAMIALAYFLIHWPAA